MRLFKNGSLVVAVLVLSVMTGFAQVPAEYSAAGVKVLVADTWLFNAGADNGTYWEPYISIFGDGTILVGANTFADGSTSDSMNMKVAYVNPNTGEVKEYWAYYTDAGTPYTGNFNDVRKDGNPARAAADQRAGGVRYVVAMESTPYNYSEFNTDKRWSKQFNYDDRVLTTQIFEKTANGPKPISKAIDPVYGGGDIAGDQAGQQMRVGEVTFLSNGNVLAVAEDRCKGIFPDGNAAIGTIFNGETGAIIKKPWNTAGDEATHSIWSNVVAFKGGFAVRTEGITNVYDNDGNLKYYINHDDWTTVSDKGRGDGSRIGASIYGNYVYFTGKNVDGNIVLSRFDAVGTTVSGMADASAIKGLKEIVVNEDTYTPATMEPAGTFDRADLAVDELGNICVTFEDDVNGQVNIMARVFKSDMTPATPSFYAFKYHDTREGTTPVGYKTQESKVSMNNKYIAIAADGITWDEKAKSISPIEQTLFVVLVNPLKETSKIEDWQLW